MVQILEQLTRFRLNRNIDKSQGYKFVLNKQAGFILSEAAEYLDAENEYDRVDALCDISVFAINAHALISEDFSNLFDDAYRHDDYYSYYSIAHVIDRIHYLLRKYPLTDVEANLIVIIEICSDMLAEMKYDFVKCMLETIKEISSRTQDPVQAIEWQESGASGKWQKDKNQDAKTKYKANYSTCKIV